MLEFDEVNWICSPFGFKHMVDRVAFFRSLTSGGVSKRKESPSDETLGRRTFWRSLSGESKETKGTEVCSEAPVAAVTISFTLLKLREFKALVLQSSAYKRKVEVPRKRPNYNSSKRKLLAKPVKRVQQLASLQYTSLIFKVLDIFS